MIKPLRLCLNIGKQFTTLWCSFADKNYYTGLVRDKKQVARRHVLKNTSFFSFPPSTDWSCTQENRVIGGFANLQRKKAGVMTRQRKEIQNEREWICNKVTLHECRNTIQQPYCNVGNCSGIWLERDNIIRTRNNWLSLQYYNNMIEKDWQHEKNV